MTTSGVRRVKVRVSGRVQGVFFRQSAHEVATRLGLSGHVKNRPDGCVEALAEGPAAAVAEFLTWCQKGPPLAQVEHVTVEDQPLTTSALGPFRVERS